MNLQQPLNPAAPPADKDGEQGGENELHTLMSICAGSSMRVTLATSMCVSGSAQGFRNSDHSAFSWAASWAVSLSCADIDNATLFNRAGDFTREYLVSTLSPSLIDVHPERGDAIVARGEGGVKLADAGDGLGSVERDFVAIRVHTDKLSASGRNHVLHVAGPIWVINEQLKKGPFATFCLRKVTAPMCNL